MLWEPVTNDTDPPVAFLIGSTIWCPVGAAVVFVPLDVSFRFAPAYQAADPNSCSTPGWYIEFRCAWYWLNPISSSSRLLSVDVHFTELCWYKGDRIHTRVA